jgi:hypothetical protein
MSTCTFARSPRLQVLDETLSTYPLRFTLEPSANYGLFEQWGEGIGASKAFLSALEGINNTQCRLLFPAVYDHEGLLAAAYFTVLPLDDALIQSFTDYSADGAKDFFGRVSAQLVYPLLKGGRGKTILMVGNPHVSGSYATVFRPGTSEANKAALLRYMMSQTQLEAGPFDVWIVKDCSINIASNSKQAAAFITVPTLPLMQVNLNPDWHTFTDYLNAMSAKYRIRAKAALKRSVGLETEVWNSAQILAHQNAIEELYASVFNAAKFRFHPLPFDYIKKLTQFPNESPFRFTVWKHADKLVGFSLLLCKGDFADAHLVGLDYAYNRSHALYLNMLYRYINDGIALRIRQLNLGRTAMEIKSTVGAEPLEHFVYFKFKNKLRHNLAGCLASGVGHETWVQRHPFKAE